MLMAQNSQIATGGCYIDGIYDVLKRVFGFVKTWNFEIYVLLAFSVFVCVHFIMIIGLLWSMFDTSCHSYVCCIVASINKNSIACCIYEIKIKEGKCN